MIKTTVKIEGMMCGMCEAHICEIIRREFPNAKKVKASRTRGELTFITEEKPDEDIISKAIYDSGYTFVSSDSVKYKKNGLLG